MNDDILNYFQIEPKLFKHDKTFLENNDIFIFQYGLGNDLSFSYGRIMSLKDNKIIHSESTDIGSSDCPIIRRYKGNHIIGLHFGEVKKNTNRYKFNLASLFVSILDI